MSASSVSYNAHLHAAIAQHDVEWARLAVQFGANVNCTDEEGNTPLHLLAAWDEQHDGLEEILALLIDAGAVVTARNHAGKTPLDAAQECDRWDLALRMASYKIDGGR